MRMQNLNLTLSLSLGLVLALIGLPPEAQAADSDLQTKNGSWQEQENWYRFTDREKTGTFKMPMPSRATAPHAAQSHIVTPGSVLDDYWRANQTPEAMGATPSYNPTSILVDTSPPAPAQPNTQTQTTLMPVGGYGGYRSFGIPGFNYASSWSHFGTPNWAGWGGYGGHWGRLGMPGWGGFYPGGMYSGPAGFRSQTQVIQTGPSRSSGNYYAPMSVDPTASGSYYANTGPKTQQVIPLHQADNTNNWGPGGNPFPGHSSQGLETQDR